MTHDNIPTITLVMIVTGYLVIAAQFFIAAMALLAFDFRAEIKAWWGR